MGEGGGSSQGFISPSLGIVQSWQGIVEMILRGVTIILALIALIAGASSQSAVENFQDTLPRDTDAAGGWLIFISFWVMLYQAIVIFQRFLNFGIINNNIMIFLIIDIILVGIGAAGYLAGAAAMANYANRWREAADSATEFTDTLRRVTDASAAAAFFGFVVMFWMIGLAVYIALGAFIFKWGPTNAKYTAS